MNVWNRQKELNNIAPYLFFLIFSFHKFSSDLLVSFDLSSNYEWSTVTPREKRLPLETCIVFNICSAIYACSWAKTPNQYMWWWQAEHKFRLPSTFSALTSCPPCSLASLAQLQLFFWLLTSTEFPKALTQTGVLCLFSYFCKMDKGLTYLRQILLSNGQLRGGCAHAGRYMRTCPAHMGDMRPNPPLPLKNHGASQPK